MRFFVLHFLMPFSLFPLDKHVVGLRRPQVETFASKFVASTPRLDVLVNNAGGMPPERVETPQGNEGIMVRKFPFAAFCCCYYLFIYAVPQNRVMGSI